MFIYLYYAYHHIIFIYVSVMDSIPKLSVVKGEDKYVQSKQIHRIFEENLATYSNNDSIIVDEDTYLIKVSYNQLNKEANKIAELIVNTKRQNQLEPNFDGDYIVAVCISPSDTLIKTLLAIWKAGAAYLPIDVSFPQDRVNHIFQESRPILFIVQNDDIKEKFNSKIKTLTLADITIETAINKTENIPTRDMIISSDLAIVQYTSGSTGIPKGKQISSKIIGINAFTFSGVRLTHSMICNRIFWQWNVFPYTEEEKVSIFKTSLTFVDSISEIWSPLLTGTFQV